MFISDLIGALIAEMVKHGDMPVCLDHVPQFDTAIRGFWVHVDEEFGTKTLMIEPIDR